MTERGSETADQANTRRRWITLAEVVAVAGVLIAALTLYNGWADRRADQADRAAAQAGEARERSRIDLTASVKDGGKTLVLSDDKHDLRDMTVTFPKALGVATQSPAETAIDAGWFDAPMLKLTDGGADDRTGRLPVLIGVTYWDGDVARTSTGIYDIVWRTHGRTIFGRSFKVEGLRLRQRTGTAAMLEAAWTREKP